MHTGEYEDAGRYGSHMCASQVRRLGQQITEARTEDWDRSSLTALMRSQTCQHLDLGLLAFKPRSSCCLNHPELVALCYNSLGRLILWGEWSLFTHLARLRTMLFFSQVSTSFVGFEWPLEALSFSATIITYLGLQPCGFQEHSLMTGVRVSASL